MQISKTIQRCLLTLCGATLLAFGMYNFNYQNHITEGGVLGLLLFFKNLFNISPALTNVLIDFSLFALGARFFGKSFLCYCFLSSSVFSISYRFFESIGFVVPLLSHNMLLASILSGIFVGIGAGLVVRAGGASGGDDVLALLIARFTPIKMQHAYLLMDLSVLSLSCLYLNASQLIWSLVAVTISGKLISVLHTPKA